MSRPDESELLDAADDRTLRLSVPSLTAENLDKLIDFQRRLVGELRAHPIDDKAFSAAHQRAASAVGLSQKTLNELEAVARSFCGDRVALRTMEQRLEEAKGKAQKTPADLRALEKLPKEIAAKRSTSTLGRRYREDVVALLETRQDTLMALHEELTALLRR